MVSKNIRDLTPQEVACFQPIDRQIPGSNLVGIAESLAERVNKQTKGKIRRQLDEVVEQAIYPVLAEVKTVEHRDGHVGYSRSPERDDCLACLLEFAIDRIGEATV